MNPANHNLYYIISYKNMENGVLCFWRAGNAGYTNDLQQAGKYTEKEIDEHFTYYNNGYMDKGKFILENVAIPCNELEQSHTIRHQVERNIDMRKKLRRRVMAALNSRTKELKVA